ncbi:MAG TPA: hypothetical protein VMN37_01460 [Gemmatimonadales bacterium]|nr:hypothetical protein [Gemmatimonadales bacterium]
MPELDIMPPFLPSPTDAPSHRPGTVYRPSVPLPLSVCPECAGPLVRASGCVSCAQCGWGRCG